MAHGGGAVLKAGRLAKSCADIFGGEDLHIRVEGNDSIQLVFVAVVIVAVGDHNCLNIGQAFERASIDTWINHKFLALIFNDQACVLILCDFHAFIVSRMVAGNKLWGDRREEQMPKIGLLVNPTSGGGRGRNLAATAIKQFEAAGIQVVDFSAETAERAGELASAAASAGHIDALVVAGGDGTVHLGVNICADADLPLGVIAIGTGNDIARTLGLPVLDERAAIGAIIETLARPRAIDLVHAKTSSSEFWFAGTASAGFDALVNARANRWSWPKGPIKYQLAMLYELASFRSIDYRVIIDGEPREFSAMLCAVANAPAFGGGMLIVPDAEIVDGKLELFIVHKISRLELIKIFPKVYSGAHIGHSAVEIIKAENVTIESANMPIYSDGEFVGRAPLSASIHPGKLKVIGAR